MWSNDQPPMKPVGKCAGIGAICCLTAAVVSVACTMSFNGWEDKDGLILPIILWFWLSVVMVPIGALVGAIVGCFLRHRGGRTQ